MVIVWLTVRFWLECYAPSLEKKGRRKRGLSKPIKKAAEGILREE